jgi:hypothetical protein
LESKVQFVLRTISNPIRYNIIKMHGKSTQYSDLMRDCGLNPLSQTGIFNQHISHMLNLKSMV